MLSLYKKEITEYFSNWTGYMVIGLFLLINGLINWVFYDTSLFRTGYASLETFFSLTPFLLLLFIPAITMRSLAGEKGDGTWEWLLTRPISPQKIIMGKFFGVLTIFLLALLPTTLYVLTIHQLAVPIGNIDLGGILGSYLGLILFAGAFAAIGLFASAMCRQVVPAFLLGVFLCLIFYLGFDAISDVLQPHRNAEFIRQLGMSYHFDVLARGVMDTRSIIYLLSLIILFLFLANRILLLPRLGFRQRKSSVFQLFTIFIALIAINYASYYWFYRLDLTQDKRYTLSAITKETLQTLPEEIQISVLLDGNLPPGFQRMQLAIRDLLLDFNAQAKGKIRVDFDNPLQGNAEKIESQLATLAERQIVPMNLQVGHADGSFSQQMLFPFALLSNGTEEQVVPFLQTLPDDTPENTINQAIENLEYAFVAAIRKLNPQAGRPIVGFSEGHGELSDLELQDAIYSLSTTHQTGRIDLNLIDFEGLQKLDVLIIAKPTQAFSEAAKYKLDYFLQHGGNLIVSLDQLNGSLDSLKGQVGQESGAQVLLTRDLNLDDLWFNYGLRFNYDLIADLQCLEIPLQRGTGTPGGQVPFQWMPWPLHPLIVPSSEHPLVNNLGNLMAEYMGTLDTLAIPGVHKTVLLHSSPYVGVLQSPATISLDMVEQLPAPADLKTETKAVAVLLEGNFPSAFQNRMMPEGLPDLPAQTTAAEPATIFAISDGDVFKNQIHPGDGSVFPLGWERFTQKQYANKILLLNLMDYMTDDPALIALRSKEVKLHLLDRLKMSEQRLLWQWVNVGIPLILLLMGGLMLYFIRRRRYETRI